MHGEIKKFVVTLLVMRYFFILLSAPKACVDFCDPTVVSRFNHGNSKMRFGCDLYILKYYLKNYKEMTNKVKKKRLGYWTRKKRQ